MAMKTSRAALAVVVICGAALTCWARNLKLIKPDEVDATDIRSLVATATRGCTTDKEKAIALWAYITRNPYYHWCTARENPEGTNENGIVLDPVSNFNVHGTVICFQVIDILGTMAEVAGIESRSLGLPGHMVSELKFDGSWHLFDAQPNPVSYCLGDDATTVLSYSQICTDPNKYILNQANPSNPFYQYDQGGYGYLFVPWESKQYCVDHFYQNQSQVYATRISWGHTIQFHLRRGEQLIRYFGNRGRWYCPPELFNTWGGYSPGYGGANHVVQGPHSPYDPKNRYANGVLVYQPDWEGHENNFLDGLYDGTNYVLADGKVRPAGTGECHVIFRVVSPYLIAGKPGQLHVGGDSYDGAIIEGDFYRDNIDALNSIAVSVDNGLTWNTVWINDQTGTTHLKLDLTDQVEGRYHYLIKVRLLGEGPAEASLANLKLTNYLFCSPVPLPAIKPGANRFKFTCKERENVLIVRPDLSENPGYQRFFSELYNLNYDPHFTNHLYPSSKGHAIMEVAAPPGCQIQWLTVDSMFGARSTTGDRARVLYRADYDPAWKWRVAWKDKFRTSVHWRREKTVDIMLPQPADKCYIKWLLRRTSHMSLNGCKVYAHYLRPEPALLPGSVKITHVWTEDGRARARTIVPRLTGQTYTINASGSAITNRCVIMEVANESGGS